MKKRILVIDDEESVRRFISRLLHFADYDVYTAENGMDAFGILERNSVDLVMLDMNMPQMDGFAFLRELGSRNTTRAPVLMISGCDDPEHIVESYQLGVYDFIKKPENPEIILKRVENGLKIGEMKSFNEFIKFELLMAKKMQQYLYPEGEANLGRISIKAWQRPLSDIGGDLYDYVFFPDGSCIFFIADVSGHSISAAMYTAIVNMVFRNAVKKSREPGSLLTYMNEELSGSIPIESFITMFCGLLDPAAGTLHYSNAGHPRPYRCSRLGVCELDGNDSFLGPISASSYRTFSLDLEPGDCIVAFTDGVLDIKDPNENQIGRQIVVSTLSRNDISASTKFEAIKKTITSGDFHIVDDCALMLVGFD
jgi:sigma-B regulation protein RsbU (phosphoserine phosphatase)